MSSVFFRFRNQKEDQRVIFDGTGITVFELKREIINLSKLGDGKDFDLILKSPDGKEEYDDDTTIVSRSTSVVAIRRPSAKPGQGRAARYVSGQMPVNAKNNYRREQNHAPAQNANRPAASNKNAMSAMENAKTEEERIQAALQMGGAAWELQQQNMSSAQRVPLSGFKNKNAPPPDHPPPPGYVCYRCGKKGHWIQVCPTNDNPEFENKPRIKRATGIPKSFLQKVEAPTGHRQDGLTDDAREPTSVMVDADGNHVVAVPDMAAWQQYQEKAKAAAANKEVVAQGSKELQERGLECSIDKCLFVDPVKTSCCKKTYCRECIENALGDHDLVCPNCSEGDVLIDDLIEDDDMNNKIKAYLEGKKVAAQKKKSPSPDAQQTPQKPGGLDVPSPTSSPTPSNKRKRSVDDDDSVNLKRIASAEGDRPTSSGSGSTAPSNEQAKIKPSAMSNEDFVKQMNAMAAMQGGDTRNTNGTFNPLAAPMMPMPLPNGMMNPMMNPMMMMMQNNNHFPGMVPAMNGPPAFNNVGMAYAGSGGNMAFPNGMNGQGMQAQGMNGQGVNGNGMNGTFKINGNSGFHHNHNNNNNFRGRGGIPTGPKRFQNQQPNQAEEAYMRKPVNPHRHQGRQKRVRPTDFKEL